MDLASGSILARLIWKKNKLRNILLFLFFVPKFNSVRIKFDYLLTYSFSGRPDHLSKLQLYCASRNIDESNIVQISRAKPSSINDVLAVLFSWVISIKYLFKFGIYSQFFEIFIAIAYTIRVVRYLNSKKLNVKNYIAFNSADMEESILCLIFNNDSVPTTGLQHGMYCKFLNDIPLDVINYENICAKQFIPWGEYSKLQIEEYLPKDVKCLEVSYDFYPINIPAKIECNIILVLLPRINYKDEVLCLLELLSKESNCDFEFKLHPSLLSCAAILLKIEGITTFKLVKNDSLQDILTKFSYRACISFNSTALFESILYGQNTIQYINENNEFMVDKISTFSNSSQFSKLLTAPIKNIEKEFFFKIHP